MKLIEYIQKLESGEIDVEKNLDETVKEFKKIDKEYNYFNTFADDIKEQLMLSLKGKIYGLPITVKDNICTYSLATTAGSAILSNYKPLFDATVITRLRKEGAIVIGKTAMDEFGFGSFNINVGKGFKIPKNPYDKARVCGGSSGGAAGITVKATKMQVAIAESTGGSIACPSAFCGCYGFTPSYGLLSRYGLIDYANSLDKIGIMSKNLDDIPLILNFIVGYDERDPTTVKIEKQDYYTIEEKKNYKLAVIKNAFNGLDPEVEEAVWKKIKEFESEGASYEEVEMPLTFEYALPAYYLIAMAEASTNLAKYCGLRYGASEKLEGNFNEFFSAVRSKYFGKEVKRRIILGTFARMAGYRNAYYIKALKVRSKIIREYKSIFKNFDFIVHATMPIIAPKFEEVQELSPLQQYMMDILTVGCNLAGLPHLNIPSSNVRGMPTGTLLIADHFKEKNIFSFLKWLR